MATTFKGEILARFGWKWTSEGIIDNDKLQDSQQLLDGYCWNQGEAVWFAEDQSLADAASTTLDLRALTRDIFGSTLTVTLVDVRGILIVNAAVAADSGTLIVGDAASNEWSACFGADGDTLEVPSGSPMMLTNVRHGWDVDATNKDLKLAASGGDLTYHIAIIGATSSGASGSGSGA